MGKRSILGKTIATTVENQANILSDRIRMRSMRTFKTHGRATNYYQGWTSEMLHKKTKSGDPVYVVRNKTDYQLTHLLEFGHIVKNQYGEFGFYQGIRHIGPEVEAFKKEFVKELEENIYEKLSKATNFNDL